MASATATRRKAVSLTMYSVWKGNRLLHVTTALDPSFAEGSALAFCRSYNDCSRGERAVIRRDSLAMAFEDGEELGACVA